MTNKNQIPRRDFIKTGPFFKKNKDMKITNPALLLCLAFLFACTGSKYKVSIQNSLNDAQVNYAVSLFQTESTQNAFQASQITGDLNISTQIDSALGNEAYKISSLENEIKIIGGNGTGVMYGLLHVK